LTKSLIRAPGYDRDDERARDDFELDRPLGDPLPEDRRWPEEPRVLDDDLLLVEDRLRPPDEERLWLRPRDRPERAPPRDDDRRPLLERRLLDELTPFSWGVCECSVS
jgi:hypothetical protein